MYKPVRRPTGRQDTLLSQEAFEAIEQDATPTLTVSLSLEGIGLSLINRSMIEVVYLSARGLKVEYMNSDISQSIDLQIGHLQIDNQLPEATFNVVFQPTPISRQGAPKLPTVNASVIILNDRCKPSDINRAFSNSKRSVRCLVYQICLCVAAGVDGSTGRGFLDGGHRSHEDQGSVGGT